MPCDQAVRPAKSYPVPVDPPPAEIRKLCAAIQATWTEAERRKRGAWMFSPAWMAPQPPFDDEMDAAREFDRTRCISSRDRESAKGITPATVRLRETGAAGL